MRKTYTDDEKRTLVFSVNQAIEQGVKVDAACKEVGIVSSQYYTWRNRSERTSTPAAPDKTVKEPTTDDKLAELSSISQQATAIDDVSAIVDKWIAVKDGLLESDLRGVQLTGELLDECLFEIQGAMGASE